MAIEYKCLYETGISNYIKEIARLRIEIFREYPYLYAGDYEYENEYLQRYLKAKNAMVLLAFSKSQIIGATTCLPICEEEKEFLDPVLKNGFDINKVFYFGESLVQKEFRGQGIGKAFFKKREEHALECIPNLEYTCFCAVVRENHRLKPNGYTPLTQFWNKQGYKENAQVYASYSWKDIDKKFDDKKQLNFWFKKWSVS